MKTTIIVSLIESFFVIILIFTIRRIAIGRQKSKGQEKTLLSSLPAPDSFPNILYRAIMSKDENLLRYAFEKGRSIGYTENSSEALINLLGITWHKLHFEIIEILKPMQNPLALEAIFLICVNPPSYFADNEIGEFAISCIESISCIGGIEAYRALTKISHEASPIFATHAKERLQRWKDESINKRYETIYSDSFSTIDLQHIEAMCILLTDGDVTLKEWALRKFVDSEISDKLSEIAIVKDLSYFECKHIVADALETSSLQFPNDDFQYQMIREQFLLRKYILREISASNLLSISFRELVMKMNTDVKFKIWSKIDVEIDIMTYERDPKLTDFEIDSYIDSELKNAFMIPFDHSERYSLQPN